MLKYICIKIEHNPCPTLWKLILFEYDIYQDKYSARSMGVYGEVALPIRSRKGLSRYCRVCSINLIYFLVVGQKDVHRWTMLLQMCNGPNGQTRRRTKGRKRWVIEKCYTSRKFTYFVLSYERLLQKLIRHVVVVVSCCVMSCHVMSCHVMSCHVMSCHVM